MARTGSLPVVKDLFLVLLVRPTAGSGVDFGGTSSAAIAAGISESCSTPYHGCNCSRCRLHIGPLGWTLTLTLRDPYTLTTVAGTHLGSLVRRGPQ